MEAWYYLKYREASPYVFLPMNLTNMKKNHQKNATTLSLGFQGMS
jgi:hypothetical protein